MSARTNTRKLTSLKTEEITDGEDMKDLNVMTRIYVITRNYCVSILCKFREYLHDVIIGLEALSPRRRLRYEKMKRSGRLVGNIQTPEGDQSGRGFFRHLKNTTLKAE